MTRGRSSNGARTPQVRNEPVPEDGADVLRVRPQGALFMKASVTAGGNMHGMTTRMAFMKYTSTPWKAFGPCCGRGFARIAVSHRIICRSIWASLNLFTMRDDG